MPRQPLVCVLALVAVALLPPVRENQRLLWSFLGAGAVLAGWWAWLATVARRHGRTLTIAVDLRPQHYVQACAQVAVLAYWGFYWREVYHSVHLVAGQLLFAYGVDMLLAWSRRDTYRLGLGPVPVILSASLFLWFKPDWFYLQFLVVGVAFAAKALLRWERDGRHRHIFNPSAFPLALCSLALIVTGTTDMTWGQEIATTLNEAPWIYVVIFAVALPGQLLFGVATMTMSAVVTMYLVGLLYYATTGTYYFVDSYIPIAVFLGMHLLFTDPSTSPRSDLGRMLFGAVYALSVVLLYALLDRVGAPTFYDKLLAVPLMNLAVRGIDRFVVRTGTRWDLMTPARVSRARVGHLASVAVWTLLFVGLSTVQAVGDTHPGQWVTFWLTACEDGRPNGCRQAARLVSAYCTSGSGWACNEYGVLLQPARRPAQAARAFRRACELGFSRGCDNLDPAIGHEPGRAPPTAVDYRIVLRTKRPVSDLSRRDLFRQACAQRFRDACGQEGAMLGRPEGDNQ